MVCSYLSEDRRNTDGDMSVYPFYFHLFSPGRDKHIAGTNRLVHHMPRQTLSAQRWLRSSARDLVNTGRHVLHDQYGHTQIAGK